MGWDTQINGDGDTVADLAVNRLGDVRDSLEAIVRYLDVIAGCLVAMAPPDAGVHQRDLDDARRNLAEVA